MRAADVYILECADGTYYTGWAYELAMRVNRHRRGIASKYTRGRLPVKCVYRERCQDKSAAMKREAAIKKMSRKQKEALIHGSKA